MSKGAFSPATVELIWVRDDGKCVRCGRGLHRDERGRSWSVHHRVARGMGGSSAAWVSGAANGIVLCGTGTTGCHGWVESNRDIARECGWLLRRNGVQLPADVPVFYVGVGRFLLDDEGNRIGWKEDA